MSAFKVAWVPWYDPRPLMARKSDGFEQVGWVWRQRARLVKNIYHGWIAFVEDQTPEKLALCPTCNRPLENE